MGSALRLVRADDRMVGSFAVMLPVFCGTYDGHWEWMG